MLELLLHLLWVRLAVVLLDADVEGKADVLELRLTQLVSHHVCLFG